MQDFDCKNSLKLNNLIDIKICLLFSCRKALINLQRYEELKIDSKLRQRQFFGITGT